MPGYVLGCYMWHSTATPRLADFVVATTFESHSSRPQHRLKFRFFGYSFTEIFVTACSVSFRASCRKLVEEEAKRKVNGEAKKEKHLLGEKGHVKPANFLDSHEKFLIGVATKGVVKLYNAIDKA